MPQYGTWTPYAGADAVRLALVLLVIAGFLAFEGAALQGPLRLRKTGAFAGILFALIWLVSWETFGVNGTTYYEALVKAVGQFTLPNSPVAPFTALSGLLGFIAILVLTRHAGWKTALGSAIVAMIAAPMIFELPFDLIVRGRIYPTPPDPSVLYTLLYFLPLFIISLSSFGLLTVSPRPRSRARRSYAWQACSLCSPSGRCWASRTLPSQPRWSSTPPARSLPSPQQ